MRKRNNERKSTSDSQDTSTVSSTYMPDTIQMQEAAKVINNIRGCPFKIFLDALYEKRGSTREKALLGMVDAFSRKLDLQFTENNYITLQHKLMHSITRGSSTEVSLASRALALLVITLGPGEMAHEIVKESIPQLSQALSSYSDSLKRISVIECLAVITFVGGDDVEETHRSLEIIWQVIRLKSSSNVALLATTISAWSFLLTTVDQLKIDSSDWQESISFLTNLIDKEDHALRIAVGDAIGVVFEIGGLQKFCGEVKNCTDSSLIKERHMSERFSCLEGLKTKILNQIRNLSVQSIGDPSTKNVSNSEGNSFHDLMAFLKTGNCRETSAKVWSNDALLKISSWSQLMQFKFLKRLLGSGFIMHMQKNEFLHDVFDVTHTKKRSSRSVEYTLNNEKDIHLFYIPHERKAGADSLKRLYKSPNSVINKARTQVLNKKRSSAQDKNCGHYSFGVEED